MKEALIELTVERAMNRLDQKLISGIITQQEYNNQVEKLDQWANDKLTAQKRAFTLEA